MAVLSDVAAERAVLAGLCKYGENCYLDVADLLQASTFTVDSNKIIYSCLENVFQQDNPNEIDIPSIYSAANTLGLNSYFDNKMEVEYLKTILDFPTSEKNTRKFAAKIRKLEVIRITREQLGEASNQYLELTGDETLTHILGIAENTVFNLSSLLQDTEREPEKLGESLLEYVRHLAENPVSQLGIPTGFNHFDGAIGGGLRNGTVNVIGARPKVGKTVLSDNMGYHIASAQNVPALNLDTEMKREDHQHRTLALMTECGITDIETGQYAGDVYMRDKVEGAAKDLEKVPYYHITISGMSFEEQLAVMRRWLAKNVGFNDDGTAKQCVIIYDYLKLMSTDGLSEDMKEYQMLGFMMTTLHNFAIRYNVPILAFMQLNRDGITREQTDTASGSDRIIWLCSNFTIFKKKSDEEIAEDGLSSGNRKLVPLISRHGTDWETSNYINCDMKGWCAKIVEGKTKFETMNEKSSDDGLVVDDDDDPNEEQIPFE